MGLVPASTASGQHNEYLQRAYALANPEAAQTLYNEWATSYDKDLNASDYASPQRAVETVVANIANHACSLTILDAGCGTGLVGQCLANSVVKNEFVVDGLDITQGMLSVARQKGVYRNLDVADLSKPLETRSDSYNVVICVGTLTKGHVGPEVFGEFVRVAKKGGLIVATVTEKFGRLEDINGKSTVSTLANWCNASAPTTLESCRIPLKVGRWWY